MYTRQHPTRTCYRASRFGPPPSPASLAPDTPDIPTETQSQSQTDLFTAETTVARSNNTTPDAQTSSYTIEAGGPLHRQASFSPEEQPEDMPQPCNPASDSVIPVPTTRDQHDCKDRHPPAPAAFSVQEQSSPLRSRSTTPLDISEADRALIEISNHNFFTRAREHQTAMAYRAASDVALEKVRRCKRLGVRPDQWDEELALQGLPPLQRWKSMYPDETVGEKEDESSQEE